MANSTGRWLWAGRPGTLQAVQAVTVGAAGPGDAHGGPAHCRSQVHAAHKTGSCLRENRRPAHKTVVWRFTWLMALPRLIGLMNARALP
ncbi:hypothetical protein [Stenotrophomonas ginsengisoli]|uniref:hypothetical protein n=1 Tax=Stenotrophomonas ginsengisoli TaxID=336566 RepID=UPI000B03C2AE|nr:hypothetical protein [Stenotrophomonas ginsengisoli]